MPNVAVLYEKSIKAYSSDFLLAHPIYIYIYSYIYKHVYIYASLKTRLKITEFEKVHFIKVNELKLTRGDLF